MEILIVLAVVWLVFGVLGAWIADQKCREGGEGFLLGVLFGPLGVLIEALLPSGGPGGASMPVSPPSPPDPAEAQRRAAARQAHLDQVSRQRDADQVRFEAMLARGRKEAEARREAAEAARASRRAKVGAACAWLDRWVVRFGWWRALPELPRLIVLGLGLAAPVVLACAWAFGGGR